MLINNGKKENKWKTMKKGDEIQNGIEEKEGNIKKKKENKFENIKGKKRN